MNKGQTALQILIGVGSGVIMFFIGWNSWQSLTIIGSGQDLAAIKEWQSSADKHFDKFDQSLEDLNRKIDLISPRLGVNPRVIDLATTSDGESYQWITPESIVVK